MAWWQWLVIGWVTVAALATVAFSYTAAVVKRRSTTASCRRQLLGSALKERAFAPPTEVEVARIDDDS